MVSILMIIAPENFRDEEYFEPKKIFEENGFSVTTASSRTGKAFGMLGGTEKIKIRIDEVSPGEYDAVVLVGGGGASIFFEDKALHALLQSFYDKGKLVAAICVSPTTLANARLLEGKQATVWKDEKLIQNLKNKGAHYTALAVTVDGRIITASGPAAAKEFGAEIASFLKEKVE
mgnify:CR=1 FL=1